MDKVELQKLGIIVDEEALNRNNLYIVLTPDPREVEGRKRRQLTACLLMLAAGCISQSTA